MQKLWVEQTKWAGPRNMLGLGGELKGLCCIDAGGRGGESSAGEGATPRRTAAGTPALGREIKPDQGIGQLEN